MIYTPKLSESNVEPPGRLLRSGGSAFQRFPGYVIARSEATRQSASPVRFAFSNCLHVIATACRASLAMTGRGSGGAVITCRKSFENRTGGAAAAAPPVWVLRWMLCSGFSAVVFMRCVLRWILRGGFCAVVFKRWILCSGFCAVALLGIFAVAQLISLRFRGSASGSLRPRRGWRCPAGSAGAFRPRCCRRRCPPRRPIAARRPRSC